VINNTTPGGDPVQIEALDVHLETSPPGAETWTEVAVPCSTEPPVPVVFEDRLVVSYVCEPDVGEIATDARLRAVVEARITGSDQVFRMESELAR
jgi:hypothetical protein